MKRFPLSLFPCPVRRLHVYALLLWILLPSLAGGTELVALITYTSTSGEAIRGIEHRLTIPPDTDYQQVTGIEVRDIDRYGIRDHKEGPDRYLFFNVDLAPFATANKKISFTIHRPLSSFPYKTILESDTATPEAEFLKPSPRIESDAREIRAIAELIKGSEGEPARKLELAFAFPHSYLDFQPQSPTSALRAVKNGAGDCTEYAYLFVALCRNLHIPSRVIAGFNFAKDRTFDKPNHHAAEIYSETFGWMPIFPNLGHGRDADRHALGKVPSTFITLKRSDVWTWANSFPKTPEGISQYVRVSVQWSVID